MTPSRHGPMTYRTLNKGGCCALSLLVLIAVLTGCGTDSGWMAVPKRQYIDPNVAHWVPFAFTSGPHLVTIKVPPGFRQFRAQPDSLPDREYGSRSEMYLLQKQYDYQSAGSIAFAEFVIWANFTKLAEPLPTTGLEKTRLIRTLNALWQKPMPVDRNPQPSVEVIGGREWIHFDFADEESFWTLLDSTTLLTVTASYRQNIQKNPAWLRDRKSLLKAVRDAVTFRD
jgi:hypothetical protein